MACPSDCFIANQVHSSLLERLPGLKYSTGAMKDLQQVEAAQAKERRDGCL